MIPVALICLVTFECGIAEMSCGPKALHRAAECLNISVSSDKVLEVCGEDRNHTIGELSTAAQQLGLAPKIVVLNPWKGPFPPDPLIAWLDHRPGGHFVVIQQVKDGYWQLWDGNEAPRLVSSAWLARRWPGPAIQLKIGPKGFPSPQADTALWVALSLVVLGIGYWILGRLELPKLNP